MYVTHEEYTGFGYSLIDANMFDRYQMKAGLYTEKNTLGRVNQAFLNDTDGDANLVRQNKMGICEIADAMYQYEQLSTGESGMKISGFSNEGYSETFAGVTLDDHNSKLRGVVLMYFTSEQLCRRRC